MNLVNYLSVNLKKWPSVKISFTLDTYLKIKIFKRNHRQTILTSQYLNLIYQDVIEYKCRLKI